MQTLKPDENIKCLILKCETVKRKIQSILPDVPKKYITCESVLTQKKAGKHNLNFADKKYLLDPVVWVNNSTFLKNRLKNLGVYTKWTAQTILDNKAAIYKGTPSDVCISEILEQNCFVSPLCHKMMLANRIDTGYLLTHR